MSRSGYVDGCDNLNVWRGAVASAIRGKRGQAFLRDMLRALDALPVPALIRSELVTPDRSVCAMGAVALMRGADVSSVDPDDPDSVADVMGIASALAKEIAYVNDDDYGWERRWNGLEDETPQKRFQRVRKWCVANIVVQPEELE
jgi:hypothetical protein